MEEIKLILDDYEISTRLQSITTDNGRNIVGACDPLQLEMPHVKIFRFAAHGFNLILKEAMEHISDGIKKIRDLILKVRWSSRYSDDFDFAAQRIGVKIKAKSLIYDCPTRWNSTVKMLDSALKAWYVLVKPTADVATLSTFTLTTDDQELVQRTVRYLETFNSGTSELEGELHSTISNVYTVRCHLEECIQETDNVALTHTVSQKLMHIWQHHGMNIVLPRTRPKAQTITN